MKKILLLFLLLIMPSLVNAASEKILVCEYDKVTFEFSPVATTKFKMELYKDENDKKTLKKFAWYKNAYTEFSSTDSFFTFDLNGQSASYSIYTQFTANNVYDIYKKIGECPLIKTDATANPLYMNVVSDSAEEEIGYIAISKGKTTNLENDTTVTQKTVCEYELKKNILGNDTTIYFQFYMKSNGNKYWKAGTSKDKMVEQLINGYNDILNLKTTSGQTYAIFLPKDEISNILIQRSFYDFDKNEYQCISANKLGLIKNGEGISLQYNVTTDEELLKDEESSTLTKPEETPQPPNFIPKDCTSLLGSPKDDYTPAFYLSVIFKVLKYVAIVILIVMTILDFVGAVASQDNEIIKKAVSKAIKRAILCVIIFLLPTIIEFVLQFIHNRTITTCEIGN